MNFKNKLITKYPKEIDQIMLSARFVANNHHNIYSEVPHWTIQKTSIFPYLFVIGALHHSKVITDDKYKGQIKALKAGTSLNNQRLYHSTINDRWYDKDYGQVHEMFFKDYIDELKTNSYPLGEYIKDIMFYFGCGWNHAINLFIDEFLTSIINNYDRQYRGSFIEYSGMKFPFDLNEPRLEYYECDCCGSEHYSSVNNINSIKHLRKLFTEKLHSYKTGNLSKIPKTEIL